MKKAFVLFALFFCVLYHMIAESPFVVIMYDVKTENIMGDFPPKRTVWANTIDKVKSLNAKAVVLKFFYDLPKEEDKYLQKSISTIPTFLQACINEAEPSNNVLNAKYEIKVDKEYAQIISGNMGWLPTNEIAQYAYDIGFVDLNDINEIPIIEKYSGKYVKSLYFSILQYVLPDLKLQNNVLINNKRKVKLSKIAEMHVYYPKKDEIEYVSLCDVLKDKVDKKIIENKIIIIGYDGINSEKLSISTGEINKHRVFIYGLYDMYNQLK